MERDQRTVLSRDMLAPFLLVVPLMPLWGSANDVTKALVRVIKDIYQRSMPDPSSPTSR